MVGFGASGTNRKREADGTWGGEEGWIGDSQGKEVRRETVVGAMAVGTAKDSGSITGGGE